jgi:hypothetical protein
LSQSFFHTDLISASDKMFDSSNVVDTIALKQFGGDQVSIS